MTFIKGQSSWNKGISQSSEAKEKNRQSHLGKVVWNKGKKGVQVAWNKGKTLSEEHRNNLRGERKSIQGELNSGWKGDGIKYRGLHMWVQSKLGNPSICSNCDSTEAIKYEWANISRTYKRDLTDWIRLCVLCHRRYDKGLIILKNVIE